jgi:transcriptional regulator with XRE-family HTH domain
VTSRQRTSGRSSETLAGSRLQSWLDANGFTAAGLENELGMSRQSRQQIRLGRDVRLETARRILGGCRRLAHREVRMQEIFDLEPEHPAKTE